MTLPLDYWETLCREATSGEWYCTASGQAPPCVYQRNGDCLADFTRDEDAEFAATARTAMPALIQEVRRLREISCEHCTCRRDHPQPCHCTNDE